MVKVENLIRSKLDLDNDKVLSSFRIGKKDSSSNQNIAKLQCGDHKKKILCNSNKIKNTSIFFMKMFQMQLRLFAMPKWMNFVRKGSKV